MPMAFAQKMWNWTKMGARVIVTPGEMTPANFSHPLLVTQKVTPQPVADDILKQDAPFGTKSDKGVEPKPSTENLELRPSVGHAAAQPSLRDNTHTADASGAMPAASASVMSDASPATAKSDGIAKPAEPAQAKPDTATAPVKSETAATEDKPAEAKPTEAARTETKPAEASAEAPKPEVSASDTAKAEAKADEPKVETPKADVAKTEAPKAETPKTETQKAAEKPAEPVKAADAPAAAAPDAKKDPARLPGLAKTDAPKRTGQIAVFISRKDSKLYVRQNFAPLFDVPVTIAASDRPLGTHVFTAEADKADVNLLHWSVVTLPSRNAPRVDDEERSSRRRKVAAAAPVELKQAPVANSPAEALDRVTIPADAMARITEALGTGGSIIISDQGINQGETGEGTDFIVALR
jgi:hypothetical protein